MTTIPSRPVSLFFWVVLLSFSTKISIAADTLTPIQLIRDGQTLVSSNDIFELGFFSPGNSKNRYLGIWYKNISIQTVVWVANRENPIADLEGVLKIRNDGNLTLINGSGSVFWSSNSRTNNPVAQLLDTGNLVVKDGNNDKPESFLWQSFDYPTDTLLPGMKLGLNLKTGLNRILTSWKNADDPSDGEFSLKLDPNGSLQLFLWKGLVPSYRSGPWNGLQMNGVPKMRPDFIFIYEFISTEEEAYYSYKLIQNSSVISRLVMNQSGLIQRFTLIGQSRTWRLLWFSPKDQCDNYEECGPYGFCNIDDSPICQCARGFEPRSPQNWRLRDGSGGCVRKTSLDCRKGDGFYKLPGMKLPDTSHSLVNRSKTLKECEEECLKNCSCMAYASSNVTGGGSGCLIWDRDLMDLRQFTGDGGQDLFIRLASSELEADGSVESSKGSTGTKKRVVVIVSVTVVVAMVVLLLIGIVIWKLKAKKSIPTKETNERGWSAEVDHSGKISKEEELPFFDLHTIEAATENFSTANKIGEGGFGQVYKGKLMEGQEIAVKRLSKCSGQGLDEFKNEVISIAKLQHRNLIRLLGCCIQGEEKMLIYEYMQNKSLDSFIFGKKTVLDWQMRFHIISGIARGLLYLHQDSRFRIIHRDLKAGNILLDSEMNPKISDFGMARIFGGDQTQAKTKRVVGTYGYMSPEYALEGLFSVKSDVFSFGVLVLEIVSGMKNRGFDHPDHDLNLLGHAWNLWKEGKGSELIDASMSVASYPTSEVLRCIHVGLLCVQKLTKDRPTMSSVVLMLGSESVILPEPKQPGFFIERSLLETDPSSIRKETSCSVTITTLEAR